MLVLPSYFFGDILYWIYLINEPNVTIDEHENYIKQTQRNHTKILGPNGQLKLTVPVEKAVSNRRTTRHIRIKESEYKREHLQSIRTAYSSSSFFASFFPLIESFYSEKWSSLSEVQKMSHQLIASVLKFDQEIKYSKTYINLSKSERDFRKNWPKNHMFNAKYPQVFEAKHGFVSNLSVLDLIFNEGPWARSFILENYD